jgi:peroxidase
MTVFEYQEDLILLCKPEGVPKPQVFWYKDGFRIVTDSRVYFDQFGIFKINEVRSDDSGEYTCKAKNAAGDSIHKFTVTVTDLHSKIITNDVINDAIKKAKGDVNKQYVDTRRHMHDRRKPKTSSDLLALLRFPKERTLLITIGEEVYERALELVFKHAFNVSYNLTSKDFKIDELLTHRQLQRIADLSGCHRHKRKVNCSQRCLNYRTSDGTCNNLKNPHMSAANTPMRRLLPSEYENGFGTPKGWTPTLLHNGYRLPSARMVSSKIISTKKITQDAKFSLMLMQWGQFFDHDLSHTVSAGSINRFSNGLACKDSCTNEQPCFSIEIDPNDPSRARHPDMCMEFIRSSAVCGTGETSLITNQVLQREQINQLTSYIDGSNVYGSNDQDAFDIREVIFFNYLPVIGRMKPVPILTTNLSYRPLNYRDIWTFFC